MINIIEFLNAVSMIPLLFMSINTNNIFGESLYPIAIKYSYTIFSICSINYHIYRTFYRGDHHGSKECFRLDATSQHAIIILTSCLSIKPIISVLTMILICFFIEVYLDMGNAQHKAIRYMLLLFGIVYTFSNNIFIIGNVILAIIFYIMAKISAFTLGHIMFHMCSTYAISIFFNDLDRFSHSSLSQYVNMSHILFMITLLNIEFTITKIYVKCPKNFEIVQLNTKFIHSCMFLYMYVSYVYNNPELYTIDGILELKKNNVLEVYLVYQIGYYMAYLISEKKSFILHHLLSIAMISVAIYTNLHHLAILSLAIFSSSTPLLSLTKLFNYLKYKKQANICFVSFSIVFFLFRVIGLLYIVYVSYVRLYDKISFNTYVIINSLLISMYILQLYWMVKIIKILMRKRD